MIFPDFVNSFVSEMDASATKYDPALLGILQHEGELEPFLDVVFGFLFRKTDFFRTMTEQQQRYGFPPGVAKNLVMQHFQKYENLMIKMEKQVETNKKSSTTKEQKDSQEPTEEMHQKEQPKEATSAAKGPEKPEEVLTNQSQFQLNPDSYNGAVRDRYSWSQNYDDVDVVVPVAKNITRGNQVKVTIERKRLYVAIRGGGEDDVVINDELKHEVQKEESMWSLEGGKSIQITLTKDTKFWWNSLLVHEEEIDIQKIHPERPVGDMGEEEKAVVDKLQFDERQKRLGLPQSHELKVHEMLKKGWDAEGSPFKGQEFDPKMFNVSPSGVQF